MTDRRTVDLDKVREGFRELEKLVAEAADLLEVYLEERHPTIDDWTQRIDIQTLDLNYEPECVLGQIFRDEYSEESERIPFNTVFADMLEWVEDNREYILNAFWWREPTYLSSPVVHSALTHIWVKEILSRKYNFNFLPRK